MYKLKTPNHLYNGVTEGVPFSQGIGHTDNKNIRNILVNDYKYEDITEEAEEATTEEDTAEEKDLDDMTLSELKEVAKEHDLSGFSRMTRDELIAFIKENTAQ